MSTRAAESSSGLYRPIPERVLIALEEVTRFTIDVLFTMDKNYMNVVKMAEVIVGADYTGRGEFGLLTLPALVAAVESGLVQPDTEPSLVRDTDAVTLVEGAGAYGVLAVEKALYAACDRATDSGAALAVARGCVCAGPPSWYLSHAADRGLVALAFMDASPSVAPTRGKKAALGTNCACFSLRGADEDLFLCDVDFANVSWEEVRRFHSGGFRMPSDWALSSDGRPTHTAGAALAGGALLPLGGYEPTDGHKGYGLLMLAHLLTGVLSGRGGEGDDDDVDDDDPLAFGDPRHHSTRSSACARSVYASAYTFVVMDPSKMARVRARVEDAVSALMQIIRHGQSRETHNSSWAPWDLELENMNRVTHMGGILYRAELVYELDELAEARGVAPMQKLASAPLQPAVDYLGTV